MNKILIPTILVATVMIAGAFAFMPVDKATTVHNSIIAAISGSGSGPSAAPSFDTITIQFRDMNFASDADRYVLLDLHREVAENQGFVVIRTLVDPECDELMVVVTDVPGTILASNIMAPIPGNDSSDVDYDFLCHAHIPSDPATVFVALARTPGQTAVITADSQITTTILSVEGS